MSSSAASDPYRLDPAKVQDPPRTLLGSLKYIGPGFVLSASIILLIVLYAAIYFKKKNADPRMDFGKGFAIWFWASAVLIVMVGIWSVAKPFMNQ